MKSAFFIAAASAGLVAAQNLTGEPDCAVPCLSTAIAAVCTPASDQACACASQGAIGQAALSCLLGGCDASALGQAQTAGAQICVDWSATATGVASTSASSAANSTGPLTTSSDSSSATGSGATATSGSTSGSTGSAASATSATRTSSSSSTSSSASATSSAGANGMGAGGVAAQAGLLGALLAGVVAVL